MPQNKAKLNIRGITEGPHLSTGFHVEVPKRLTIIHTKVSKVKKSNKK